MKKLYLIILMTVFFYIDAIAKSNNSYEAWVGEWVELACPEATVPYGWEAAILHSYYWSVSSSASKKVTLSRKTTPTIGVTPNDLYDGDVTITVEHSFYLSKVAGGQQVLKASSEKHRFYLSCKKVNIYLYPVEATLRIGDNISLQYTYDEINANPEPRVSFESDNPSVISVDYAGNLYAKSEGVATITAKTNYNTYAQSVITVKPVDVISVTFPVSTLNLNPGQETTLVPNIIPLNSTYKDLVWSSSDDQVVAVNSDGVINAISPGFAEIRATARSGAFGCCYINVLPIDIAYISLDKMSLDMQIGEKYALVAKIYPENATYKFIDWQSDNSSVAEIDQNGVVTAISVGTANISAIANNGLSAKCVVSVTESAGIDEILLSSESEEYVVYTINGINLGSVKLKDLKKGVYLIKFTTGKVSKLAIR